MIPSGLLLFKKTADLSAALGRKKHIHEGSAELQIPRLRSG